MSEEQATNQQLPETNENLSNDDRHVLEMAKMNRKLALAAAEKALAENNSAELSYKYVVLQLYMKYGLTEADAIDENGGIHRGANAK
jgi:hypothetical protein